MNIIIFLFLCILMSLNAYSREFNVYIDADFTHEQKVSESIEKGLRTALYDHGYSYNGHSINIIKLDHRGNTTRSKLNFKQIAQDPNALYVVAGMHSPPLISGMDYINKNKILTFVPWAAGGPITRPEGNANWIYRVSLDDKKVAFVLGDYAMKKAQCKKPHMVLENTPWGASNYASFRAYFEKVNVYGVGVTWVDWSTGEKALRVLLNEEAEHGVDCFFLVLNTAESIKVVNALHSLSLDNIQLISHWGIMGGGFENSVLYDHVKKINLRFVQPCFNFNQKSAVFKTAQRNYYVLYGKDLTVENVGAPAGFFHAYDIGVLISRAVDGVDMTRDIVDIREDIAHNLETLDQPVSGILKKYDHPFSAYSPNEADAHEALELDDFCIGEFNEDMFVRIVKQDYEQ